MKKKERECICDMIDCIPTSPKSAKSNLAKWKGSTDAETPSGKPWARGGKICKARGGRGNATGSKARTNYDRKTGKATGVQFFRKYFDADEFEKKIITYHEGMRVGRVLVGDPNPTDPRNPESKKKSTKERIIMIRSLNRLIAWIHAIRNRVHYSKVQRTGGDGQGGMTQEEWEAEIKKYLEGAKCIVEDIEGTPKDGKTPPYKKKDMKDPGYKWKLKCQLKKHKSTYPQSDVSDIEAELEKACWELEDAKKELEAELAKICPPEGEDGGGSDDGSDGGSDGGD